MRQGSNSPSYSVVFSASNASMEIVEEPRLREFCGYIHYRPSRDLTRPLGLPRGLKGLLHMPNATVITYGSGIISQEDFGSLNEEVTKVQNFLDSRWRGRAHFRRPRATQHFSGAPALVSGAAALHSACFRRPRARFRRPRATIWSPSPIFILF